LTQAARDEQSAAHLARAKALWSSGNAKEALDECDAALKLDRTNAEASALREKYARALDILNGTNQ
jgi:Flp pilus assembly protein TadD